MTDVWDPITNSYVAPVLAPAPPAAPSPVLLDGSWFPNDGFPEADPELVRRFLAYHAANPGVYIEFKAHARRMRATGRTKYSAWTIIQAIRWHYDLRTVGDVFKINNDFIALYARALTNEDFSFAGFFELRAMKPTRRLISREERDRRGEL